MQLAVRAAARFRPLRIGILATQIALLESIDVPVPTECVPTFAPAADTHRSRATGYVAAGAVRPEAVRWAHLLDAITRLRVVALTIGRSSARLTRRANVVRRTA